MNFGSEFVYDYDESDEEVVSDDEFETGLVQSSSSDSEEEKTGLASSLRKRLSARFSAKPKKAVKKKKSHWRMDGAGTAAQEVRKLPVPAVGRRWRRADTNVVSITFDVLTKPSNMHTGDAAKCGKCEALMSHISKLHEVDGQTMWTCEFCDNTQACDLVSEELPTKEDVTYMISSAPAVKSSGSSGTNLSLTVFCVDVSGSMCYAKEVHGKLTLRGSEKRRREMQNLLTEEDGPQRMPGQSSNITYVSRLQSMQAAVDSQIEEMSKEYPEKKVSLVSFSNDVCVYGDGVQDEVNFCGDMLRNKDALIEKANQLDLPQSVKNSKESLLNKLYDLEEMGQTALGPALLVSIVLASKTPGSNVVICTDGLANVGLGRLDNVEKESNYKKASDFYDEIGKFAVEHGVSVSVISIEGTSCRLIELGKVANVTQGQVNMVDPSKLTTEFSNVMSDRILATNVSATFMLHSGLYIREDDDKKDKVTRYIGNVTQSTEITFEYGVRTGPSKKKMVEPPALDTIPGTPVPTGLLVNLGDGPSDGAAVDDVDVDANPGDSSQPTTKAYDQPATSQQPEVSKPSKPASGNDAQRKLPFQVQVTYTSSDGGIAMRVLTQTKLVTKRRYVAEMGINSKVIGVHTAQKSADYAAKGHYTKSRLNTFMNQRLFSRQKHSNNLSSEAYDCFYDNIAPLQNTVQQRQQSEILDLGHRLSDDEDMDFEEVSTTRARTSEDAYAVHMYANKSTSHKHFK